MDFATILGLLGGVAVLFGAIAIEGSNPASFANLLSTVVVFGGASLLTHDPRFVMLKPSLIYVALGVVMMQRGWMVRYIPPVARAWGEDVATVFGYLWAVMMFATAGLNLALVANGDPKLWAVFIGVFPIASKMVLVAIQYLATRMIIVGRMRGAATRA